MYCILILGDLGLVPRPSHAIPTSMDKTKALSETTRLGSLRRVLTKSIGIQTVSAPKVCMQPAVLRLWCISVLTYFKF